jgi:hypothetical protein
MVLRIRKTVGNPFAFPLPRTSICPPTVLGSVVIIVLNIFFYHEDLNMSVFNFAVLASITVSIYKFGDIKQQKLIVLHL